MNALRQDVKETWDYRGESVFGKACALGWKKTSKQSYLEICEWFSI